MSPEQKAVRLSGVKSDLKRYIALGEVEYTRCISEIGSRVAENLNKFVSLVEDGRVFGGFTFWDFEKPDSFDGQDAEGNELIGLSLQCGDFYADRIVFFRDEMEEDCYILSIVGGTNYKSDLWNGFGSELQLVFKMKNNDLMFSEVLFVGQQDHNLRTYQFDIEDQAKLKIMSIADRAMQVFTRMELVKDRPTLT